jgi:hypothetical protein
VIDEHKKQFEVKDVFFNNGIVNLYQFLQNQNFDLTCDLSENTLVVDIGAYNEKDIYCAILNSFFKQHNIVHQTQNDRYYFDEKRLEFILGKKFDTKGGQKNDLRNGVYIYKKVSEFGLTRENAEKLYLEFCEKFNLKPEREANGNLKVPNKDNEVVIAITLEEAIQQFVKYLTGTQDNLSIDSKIHSFEDGQNYFHDMLKQPKNYKIDKWDALVYWFGSRIYRFYNHSYFIYPNSANLNALKVFKESLEILDDKITIRDSKTDKIKEIGTNIDFFSILQYDEIRNEHFYISRSAEEFEIKFFMYIYSYIAHIEERYERSDGQRRVNAQELYDALRHISFVIYTDDGTFKTSFNEYTKAYQLIQFFYKLKEQNLFKYLSDILVIFSLSQGIKEVNINLQRWCQNMLNFSNLRKEYYLASFNILKNNSKGFGKLLYEFEETYLKYMLGGNSMDIHKESKKVGDGIGLFCAELGDKDLLFKLRNVKNHKQLVSYFKDVKFSTLKHEREARFSKEFNESLESILESIEQNWEITRDYIAIYAIDKFKAVSFAKKSTNN